MTPKFKPGDVVLFCGEDRNFVQHHGCGPMEVVAVDFQPATVEPKNAVQAAFFRAGEWPLVAEAGHVCTVRYRPGNAICSPERRLVRGENHGVTMVHEKFLELVGT